MKKTGCWACILLFTHIIMGCVEVNFIQRTEGQSAELCCSLEQVKGHVSGLHLYHSSGHNHMTTVLSMMDGGVLRVDQDYRGRLEVTGGLDSSQVRVVLSPLRSTDTGRYVWEFTYRAQNSSESELVNNSNQQVLLLVEGAGRRCQCSSSYPLLLYVISAAAGTLVVTLIWLTAAECARARKPHKAPPPAPIYEEMTAEQQGPEASRKQQQQQGAGRPQNNPEGPEGPSHLEEAVYANPTNFYACPRQTGWQRGCHVTVTH